MCLYRSVTHLPGLHREQGPWKLARDRDRDRDLDLDLDREKERLQGRAAEAASLALRQRQARRSGGEPSSVITFTRFARGERDDRRRTLST
jgi:Ni/Co efflux regulator RcnB